METKRLYHVYIMTNASKTLYVGVTGGLEGRVLPHREKQIEGFTKRYNLTMLVYYEEFEYMHDAIAREEQLKSWTRAKKVAQIEAMNPEWRDISEGWFREER